MRFLMEDEMFDEVPFWDKNPIWKPIIIVLAIALAFVLFLMS